MEIPGKFYIKVSGRKKFSLNSENVLEVSLNFQYFQPVIHPHLPLHMPPAHEEQLSEDKGEFSCRRMCKAPQKHRSSQVWGESFTALINSFSYFLALRFLYSPSPISFASILTLLHLGFLLGTCSMSGLPLHFVLAPWIFSYSLFPKFSSVCDSAGHDKSSHVYSWKWIILGEKQLADRLKALSDELKVI